MAQIKRIGIGILLASMLCVCSCFTGYLPPQRFEHSLNSDEHNELDRDTGALPALLAPAFLEKAPTVISYSAPSMSEKAKTFKTFSVILPKTSGNWTAVHKKIAKQLARQIRNRFVALGYQYRKVKDKPDFVVTYSIASYLGKEGRHPALFGTTSLIEGYYYPSIELGAYETKSFVQFWKADGIGQSKSNDIEVSVQGVLGAIIKRFPTQVTEKTRPDERLFGFTCDILTGDGVSYYPVVFKTQPALRKYDLIVALNGQTTVNMGLDSFFEELEKNTKSTLTLMVRRANQEQVLELEIPQQAAVQHMVVP